MYLNIKLPCTYVIEKKSIAPVASLFYDREMRVTAKQRNQRGFSRILSRVSRGSALAPLLFLGKRCSLQYGIDIPTRIKSDINIFADARKLCKKIVHECATSQKHKTILSVLRNGT